MAHRSKTLRKYFEQNNDENTTLSKLLGHRRNLQLYKGACKDVYTED